MIYAKHKELGKILAFEENEAVYEGRVYRLHSDFTLCTEMEYAIQEKLDLTGRYLKALVYNPDGMRAIIGDILLITDKKKCNNITNKSKGWSFSLHSAKYELLPKAYKPEITSVDKPSSVASSKVWCFTDDHFRKAEEHEKPVDNNNIQLTEEHLGSLLSSAFNRCLRNIKIVPYREIYIRFDCDPIKKPSNSDITTLYIPEVKEVPVKVDYSGNVKLIDIKLPDFSIKPEKIELIKVEPYKLNI